MLGVGDELAVLGVEAKVRESFGPFVAEWLAEGARAADGGANRRARLEGLCGLLGLDPAAVGGLRYQLLHRTAATLLEARRYRAKRAVMLVQSFCPEATGFGDYAAFVRALRLEPQQGGLTGGNDVSGVILRLGWCSVRAASA